jgi:hypothetical protein
LEGHLDLCYSGIARELVSGPYLVGSTVEVLREAISLVLRLTAEQPSNKVRKHTTSFRTPGQKVRGARAHTMLEFTGKRRTLAFRKELRTTVHVLAEL